MSEKYSTPLFLEREHVHYCAWQDKKLAKMISTLPFDPPSGTTSIQRFVKGSGLVDIEKPDIVCKYNAHMGGVDLDDMKRSLCERKYKSKRWYLCIILRVLNVTAVNACILHSSLHPQKKDKTLRAFKEALGRALCSAKTEHTVNTDGYNRLDGKFHRMAKG